LSSLEVLRRRADFVALAQKGKKFVAPGLILQAMISPDPKVKSGLRYGLTASSKIGNAVVRNRARRRLRSLVQTLIKDHAMLGYDYVLIARAITGKRSYLALSQDLSNALRTLSLWRD
jgi:ribonuclease P protein component